MFLLKEVIFVKLKKKIRILVFKQIMQIIFYQ